MAANLSFFTGRRFLFRIRIYSNRRVTPVESTMLRINGTMLAVSLLPVLVDFMLNECN